MFGLGVYVLFLMPLILVLSLWGSLLFSNGIVMIGVGLVGGVG